MQLDDHVAHEEHNEQSTSSTTNTDNTLEQELNACKLESAQWKERYMRLNADTENMRKRMSKDYENSLYLAQADIFTDLLAFVDNFDRALMDQKSRADEACKSWFEGIELIRKELASLLSSYNVEEIEQMQTFDPELHEALAHVESATHESGAIVDILQKGYQFKGRVLRHAKVTVAR